MAVAVSQGGGGGEEKGEFSQEEHINKASDFDADGLLENIYKQIFSFCFLGVHFFSFAAASFDELKQTKRFIRLRWR